MKDKTTKDLTAFKDFKLLRKPDVESYTFRGNNVQYWFNITFVEGRIILTGDCEDNIFNVRGTNTELKEWCHGLDMDYALGKGITKKDYFEEDYARYALREHLVDHEYPEPKIEEILSQLDFMSCEMLLSSMSALNDIFPDYWEMARMFLQWSPMQQMQFKQLLFAGNWFMALANEEVHG